jgi:class 3 adenylate cyclase/tetratricopeptide (TPR) repeat protein
MTACAVCGFEVPEGFKFCPECGAEVARAGREQRKVVTILFCDVVGSTALGESVDPEALRALLARYFERMKQAIERHGGTVEKFIGDAVMAVFGVPVAHEDDALRACRAAGEMRDTFAELGIEGRIGITSGEVVTGTEERLATGDAVNVAARLQQAAEPGEVLVGGPTLQLVRESVEVDALEPLELKGKAQPVEAFRLKEVHELRERRAETRFVGREQELATVRAAWDRAAAESRCELVTIVGEAGVGKSRLVGEALAEIGARIVSGRCLPYGEGITYWPVVGVVKQLDALPSDARAAAAIRSLLGEEPAGISADDIAWAFRKLLEERAPLIVVFDDIHWGEETFLDLLEHVALLSSGSPLLLLCMARPELLERRPEWPVTFRLEPLPAADVAELIPAGMEPGLRDRISRAAGGNPLFVTEMVAMTHEAEGDVVVPPTLQALLAARLDQLDRSERAVLERGAVEGEIFHRGAVQALAPEELQVTPRLAALVRRQLIRPDAPQLPGEDGFRFRHLLIRDSAYEALAKAARADLHERFARWLEEYGASLVELDEIVGYHLEQADGYRRELGLPVDDKLRANARDRLRAAGERARVRQDQRAAASLFERAAALVPPGELDLSLEVELIEAFFWGERGADALARAASLAERAAEAGDRVAELCGRLEAEQLRTWLEPDDSMMERLDALLEEAFPVLKAAGDDLALYVAYTALGQLTNMRTHMDKLTEAYDQAAVHADRARFGNRLIGLRNMGRFHGSTSASELLAWQDGLDAADRRDVWFRGYRAQALAMLGRFDEARPIIADLLGELNEIRGFALAAMQGEAALEIELLAGDFVAAVAAGEEGCRVMEELGQQSALSTVSGRLALAYCELGRMDEAETWADRSAELGGEDDAITQMFWRQARAKVLARRGEHEEAQRLAREATSIADETQVLNDVARAHADLAEVLALGGHAEEAAEALEQALPRYERKGNLVMAERVRTRLAELRDNRSGLRKSGDEAAGQGARSQNSPGQEA